MSLSRHPACPRQGPAVPVPAPSRICLTFHHASRKLDVLATELFQFVVFRSGVRCGIDKGLDREREKQEVVCVYMCLCVLGLRVLACVRVYVLRRGAPATVAFWCHAQRERERSGAHTILRRGKRQLLDAMVSRWLWRLIDVKCNNFALR